MGKSVTCIGSTSSHKYTECIPHDEPQKPLLPPTPFRLLSLVPLIVHILDKFAGHLGQKGMGTLDISLVAIRSPAA